MRAILSALFIVCACGSAVLAQEPNVVMGEVAVANRNDSTRAAALPDVLAEALRRLTPEAEPQSKLDLAAALDADPLLLQRFEYEQVIRPTTSGIPSIKLMLRGWFHAPQARSLLVRAGVPVWPGGGVQATLWLVDDSTGQRHLLDDREQELLAGLRASLGGRGIRVLPALNDLEDWRMAESLSEEGTAESLAMAALRTGAEPAVLAWLGSTEAGLSARWFVHVAGRDHRFETAGTDAAEAIAAGAPALLELLASQLAVRPESVIQANAGLDRGAGAYSIWLTGLDRAGSYVQALELLRAQPVVTGVSPEQADGDRVRVRVQVSAPLGQLLALLAADGRLRVLAGRSDDADVSLHWQP